MIFLKRRALMSRENGIEKLAWIQSTGTQYIDTEYIPKVNTVLKMDIQFDSISSGTAEVIGVSQESGDCFAFNFFSNLLFFWIDKLEQFGGTYATIKVSEDMKKRNNMTIDAKGKVKYCGIERGLTPKTKNMERTLYLFGYNTRLGTILMDEKFKMRLYSCEIYEDDVLIKNFVPAKVGEKVGLYDNVSKKFHENKGTGEFLYA